MSRLLSWLHPYNATLSSRVAFVRACGERVIGGQPKNDATGI